MTTLVASPFQSGLLPSYVESPKIPVRFRVLRDGEVTSGVKNLFFYRGRNSLEKLELHFWAEPGFGEFTQTERIEVATLLAQGEWLVTGYDDAAPKRVRSAWLTLVEGTLLFNITSGEGAAPGEPGQLTGVVRVDRLPADREIVVIERGLDGAWRVAGNGPTPGGSGVIDVRVVGGDVYAVCPDAWGAAFAPSLPVAVGQRIRPVQFGGWVYEITEPGVLPATEPAWWAAEGDNASRPLGTARAVAQRYYQPLAEGPLPVEV